MSFCPMFVDNATRNPCKRLREKHVFLVTNLDFKDTLKDKLFECGLLNENNIDRLEVRVFAVKLLIAIFVSNTADALIHRFLIIFRFLVSIVTGHYGDIFLEERCSFRSLRAKQRRVSGCWECWA